MMNPFVLEACVDSVESALAAVKGGATRLELCSNLVIGGTTPGVSLFKQVRACCDVPVHVLLRPRYGDFLYTEPEFQMVLEDGEMLRALGADGIVAGCLTADGNLDLDRMEKLRKAAGNGHLTLHRAFDVCRDPFQALEEAVSIGADTILTSGQKDSAPEGAGLLKELTERAGSRLAVMAGGGVCAGTIDLLAKECGIRNFHMSGKISLDSGMVFRKEGVNMGIPGLGEYTVFRTEESQIRAAREAIEKAVGYR